MDVKNIDFLMKIPKQVPNIFIFDIKPYKDKKLLFRFTGTGIDKQFSRSITGKYFEDILDVPDSYILIQNFYDVIEKKKIGFARKQAIFKDGFEEKTMFVERISIPCSSNEMDINSIIGMIVFDSYSRGKNELVTSF